MTNTGSSPLPSARRLVGLACLLPAAACISQAQYDEAVTSAEHFQRSYHDAQQHVAELEAENQRLKDRLASGGVPAEASAYMSDIDQRIEDLDQMLAGLGQAKGDVTVKAVEGGVAYEVKDSVLFDSGSATVRPAGRELIARLAQDIVQQSFERILVRGHTDSDPVSRPETMRKFPHGNIELSAARAVEVAALLLKNEGISERGLGVVGLGSSRPVAPNDSEANKQLNRRVEIVVLERPVADPELGG